MLIILDSCNVGVGREPSGGVTLQFRDIEGAGFLEGVSLMVPLGKESAKDLVDSMTELLGPRIVQADLNDMKRETGHGS